MVKSTNFFLFALVSMFMGSNPDAKAVSQDLIRHNYVYFGGDRDHIKDSNFLTCSTFEGAQLTYSWRQLEHGEDGYDFSDIHNDLNILRPYGKRIFVQLKDASFDVQWNPVPKYLLKNPKYHGGANYQYGDNGKPEGWVARRWDPEVRARFEKLLQALAKDLDGKIAGINLQETAIGVAETGPSAAPGFTYTGYRDSIESNMLVLRESFHQSIPMQYVNFFPGEWLPTVDRGLMKSVFDYGEKIGVAIGAPDLMPNKPAQQNNAYKFMHEKMLSGKLTIGIAVQDGNYSGQTGDTPLPKPGSHWPDIVPDISGYAKNFLGVSWIFWGAQEPYFNHDVVPFVCGSK